VEVLAVHDRLTLWVTVTTPLPERVIVAGEPVALLVIVTLPLTLPVAVGLNITLKVNFCNGVSVTGTLTPLSVYPVPAAPIAEICTFELPVLVIVTGCVEDVPFVTFPKLTAFVLSVRISVAATPVPVSATTVGDVAALLTNVILPLADPAAAG
jgi:hypothetical protein